MTRRERLTLRIVMLIDALGIVRARERQHQITVRRLNQALARIAHLEGMN